MRTAPLRRDVLSVVNLSRPSSGLCDARPSPAGGRYCGTNGAGKPTFHGAYFAASGLPYINADRLALELEVDAYAPAEMADALRRPLVAINQNFATVR